MLSETKATSVEVESNIAKANETALNITRTRESYRDTAARGSVLYFLMVEMSLVNPMYQTSLQRFLQLFNKSIESAEQVLLLLSVVVGDRSSCERFVPHHPVVMFSTPPI